MKKGGKRVEEVTSVLSLPLVLVLVLSVLIIPFFNEDPVLKNAITGEVTIQACGDGVIGPGEQCEFDSQCPSNFPKCTASCNCISPPNGGGGGSRSRTTTPCTESWTCDSWKECDGKLQTRVCTDANVCNTTVFKPTNVKSCVIEEAPVPAPEVKFNFRSFGIVAFSLISIGALVLLIINLIRNFRITKV